MTNEYIEAWLIYKYTTDFMLAMGNISGGCLVKKIAIYGKGGIGKSTTVSNLSVALTKLGLTVMQIGCDPKADSTTNLMDGLPRNTVLDTLRENRSPNLEDLVYKNSLGVYCVESGGPIPGTGCAGRGIITAFEKLSELSAFEVYSPDIVLYDVLGDVVCGGFAMPIRGGYAEEVYIVTSGEMMSLYAASNISSAVNSFRDMGYATLGGIILNAKNIENEQELVEKAAKEMGTEIVYTIPRDSDIQKAEVMGKTAVEAFPEASISQHYKELARILAGELL